MDGLSDFKLLIPIKELSQPCSPDGVSCLPKTHREWKENPGHLIDFKDFIHFLMTKQPESVDPHFSPIAGNISTRTSTRNVCNMKYTAIVKIESLKEEFVRIMSLNQIKIPAGFETMRHTVPGGTSPADGMEKNQEKVHRIFQNVTLADREKILKFYERDFLLFEYRYSPVTNNIL